MTPGILDSVGPDDTQTRSQWFTKPLRGVLGGHSITIHNGQPALNQKIFGVWKRIIVGILLIPGLLFYTIPAVIVLFLSCPVKDIPQATLKTNQVAELKLSKEILTQPSPIKESSVVQTAHKQPEPESYKPLSIDHLLCLLQPQMEQKPQEERKSRKLSYLISG